MTQLLNLDLPSALKSALAIYQRVGVADMDPAQAAVELSALNLAFDLHFDLACLERLHETGRKTKAAAVLEAMQRDAYSTSDDDDDYVTSEY